MVSDEITVPVPEGVEIIEEDGAIYAQQAPDPETGLRTDPDEFGRYYDLLMAEAPDGYVPHLLRCAKGEKGPALQFGSWKAAENRLDREEAIEWLREGGNVGIAGIRADPDDSDGIETDPLVNMDIDDRGSVPESEVVPSLGACSRSRIGDHRVYFDTGETTTVERDEDDLTIEIESIPNIAPSCGEIRTDTQYVVAPGSHVPIELSDPDDPDLCDIPEHDRENIGRYTVEHEQPATEISYTDLPEVYREFHEDREFTKAEREANAAKKTETLDQYGNSSNSDEHVEHEFPEASSHDNEDIPDGCTDAYSLSIKDVAGVSRSYRGVNPIGHHTKDAEMGDYFVVLGEDVAYDHKDNVAFNPTTYILADCGERNPERPEGPLSLREHFVYWKECKERGLVPADDPIPRRALIAAAKQADLVSDEEITDGWKLPKDAYNDTLDAIEERGLDHGRERLTDPEQTSVIPFAQLDALSPDERRRAARKRGLNWPGTDEARKRLRLTVTDAMSAKADTVIEAPTSLGKSHTIDAMEWSTRGCTGDKPVVKLDQTRDARDESIDRSREADVVHQNLYSSAELCPARMGELDGDVTMDGVDPSIWFTTQCEEKGIPFGFAHSIFEQHNDQGHPHPCGDTCPYDAQMEALADGDLAPLIHATHNFARVPRLRCGTIPVFDEQPDFDTELTTDRVRRAMNAYLSEIEAPVRTWEEFIALVGSGWQNPKTTPGEMERRDSIEELRDALEQPKAEWFLNNPDAHTLVHPIAVALAGGTRRDSGEYFGKTKYCGPWSDPDGDGPTPYNWLSIVLNENNEIEILRDVPDFTYARCVIGLDGHPDVNEWQSNTVPWIESGRVLSIEEQQLWRRYERGLRVVEVGNARRPLSSEYAVENYLAYDKLVETLEAIREEHGGAFKTAITTRRAKPILLKAMREAGIPDPTVMTFGNTKSNNDFAGEEVGFVYGCHDPGDDHVMNRLAELDKDARPVMIECPRCAGAGCDHCDGAGEVREHGRTFEGPDADTANELLAAIQHNQVAQAAGRYARDPENPSDNATVYVNTTATPTGFADVHVEGVITTFGEKQQAIAAELRSSTNRLTAKEIADATDASKQHVNTTLKEWHERGFVDANEGAGKFGATEYAENAIPRHGITDIEIDNCDVLGHYTWELSILAPALDATAPDAGDEAHAGGEEGEPTGDVALDAFLTPG